jgi:hypothetical protein
MKTWILFFLLATTLSSFSNASETLKPFLTDYCTAYPEGTLKNPDQWKHCCVEHDLFFWAGGSVEDRKMTDLRLKKCVEDSGAPIQARLIYAAVSIGGQSPIRFKTKEWGHAWEGRVRYQSLSEKETGAAINYIELLESQDLPAALKQSFKETLNTRLDIK